MVGSYTSAEMLNTDPDDIHMFLGIQAAEGDISGFDDMYAQYFRGIRNTIDRKFGGNPSAEDVVQDAFIKAYKAIEEKKFSYRGQKSLYNWLTTIAINHALDVKRRYSHLDVVPVDFSTSPLDRSVESDFTEAIVAQDAAEFMLRPLSANFADVVRAIDVEGDKYDEYSADTGINMGTVRSRLHRARKELRQNLEAEDSTEF